MSEILLLAKAAALKKNFDSLVYSHGRISAYHVRSLLPRYESILTGLKNINPELYSDIPDQFVFNTMPEAKHLYAKDSLQPIYANLDYILELSSNVRIGENILEKLKPKRIFISHGKSIEWVKVQMYLERDLEIQTLELAQEPNIGRSILQKLNEESQKCSIAVIVMTGDDIALDGEVRARENVMHEIGFFQGKYGLKNIVLLHEQGVNIPTNIYGLAYIPFPKDCAEAALGALTREMKVLMN